MEIASLKAVGKSDTEKDSMTPSRSPAATAARLLPRPPRMATVKPLMARPVPMPYWVWVMGLTTQPASAPMPALSTKERVMRFRVGRPQSEAATRLAAQARICRPSMVKRKKAVTSTTSAAQAPSVQSTCGETRAPPTAMEVTSLPVK
jgi:hypothetical protein